MEQATQQFKAFVKYEHPSYEELRRRFSAYVHPDYENSRIDPMEIYKDVSQENREVTFEYVQMGPTTSTDAVLTEMDRRGLRPALYEELLAFDEKYPDEQRNCYIIALGSGTRLDNDRDVAFLWGEHGRSLNLGWVGSDWRNNDRFLAVPI